MKKCTKCNETKPLELFAKHKKAPDGLHWNCKACQAIYRKKIGYNKERRRMYYDLNKDKVLLDGKIWRENNKERHAEMSAKWYRKTKVENSEKYLWKYAKARANKKGLDFNIEIEDIIIPEYCPYLGYKLELGYGSDTKKSPSLDRIDPTKGYIKGNIQVVCRLFNSMKWDSNQEELIHFCKSVLEKEGIAYVVSK